MRSIQYDTVSDLYPRFLRDEVLPLIYSKYNIRKDGYSHAIAGNSSGGICAFNAAWYMPELFSRVVARVPSFTALQWKPGEQDGGNIYPFRVRREAKRNIRVWMQDGSEDMEAGSGAGRCRISRWRIRSRPRATISTSALEPVHIITHRI